MTLKQQNDLAMAWVDAADVSELTKEHMFSSVAWFLFKADKEGYELAEKKRTLRLGDSISREDVAQMLRDKVAY
jgi:hypothetical protein